MTLKDYYKDIKHFMNIQYVVSFAKYQPNKTKNIIEEIYKGSKEVKVSLIEADEKSVMYRVNFMLNENSRKN